MYSLGLMLYEFLRGDLPKYNERNTAGYKFPDIPKEKCGDDLNAVILKAVSPNPDDCYESAKAFKAELDRIYEDFPIEEEFKHIFTYDDGLKYADFEIDYDDIENSYYNVIIPDGFIEIADYAFKGRRDLGYIEIPESVTLIGKGAFDGCNVVYIDVHKNNPRYTAENAVLYDNVEKVLIRYQDDGREGDYVKHFTVPDGITSIGSYAFCNSRLESIVIPDSVISIGDRAFNRCRDLLDIYIPDSVETVGEWIFRDNNADLLIHCSKECYDRFYVDFIDYENGDIKYADDNAAEYEYAGEDDSYIIPDDCTEIANGTFRGRNNLKSVYIHDGIIGIGDGAFDGCPPDLEIHCDSKIYGKFRDKFVSGRPKTSRCHFAVGQRGYCPRRVQRTQF